MVDMAATERQKWVHGSRMGLGDLFGRDTGRRGCGTNKLELAFTAERAKLLKQTEVLNLKTSYFSSSRPLSFFLSPSANET